MSEDAPEADTDADGQPEGEEAETSEKYVIFKVEDFEKFVLDYQSLSYKDRAGAIQELQDMAVPDGVVIRHQDRYSVLTFATYAEMVEESIENFAASLKEIGEEDTRYPGRLQIMLRLHDLAHYMREQEALARGREDRKYPD